MRGPPHPAKHFAEVKPCDEYEQVAADGGGDGSSAFLSPTKPAAEGGLEKIEGEGDEKLPPPLEVEELPPRKIVLGRLAKAALQDAAPVPDEVLVGLVVEAIVALRESPGEEADAGAAKGGKDAKAKGGKAAAGTPWGVRELGGSYE